MTNYCRIQYLGNKYYAELKDNYCYILDKSYYEKAKFTGQKILKSKVKFIIPIEPSKIIGIGKNFKDKSNELLKFPQIFLKPTSSLTINAKVKFPPLFNSLIIEGELGVLISKKAKQVSIKDANKYIFGFLTAVDFSGRDAKHDYPITALLKKGCDEMLPISKLIYTSNKYNNFDITTKLDSKVIQKDNTSNLIFSVAKSISYISRYITLNKGDLILMGTPSPKIQISKKNKINVNVNKKYNLELNFDLIK